MVKKKTINKIEPDLVIEGKGLVPEEKGVVEVPLESITEATREDALKLAKSLDLFKKNKYNGTQEIVISADEYDKL